MARLTQAALALSCALQWAPSNACAQEVAPPAGFDWNPRRFEGRDYIAAEKIAGFYGLASSGSYGGYSGKAGGLSFKNNNREASIDGVKYWLSFPPTERDGKLWISRLDLSKTIEPALRPAQGRGLYSPAAVILDPGHGGRDKGATGLYQYEKNFTLDLARRVRDRLRQAGVKVVLTRNSDSFLELDERAAITEHHPGAIFVSLHFNSSPNPAANGLEIFSITPRGAPSTEDEDMSLRDLVNEPGNAHDETSFLLAGAIYGAMHGKIPMFDRGIKRARFAVLRLSECPAVLVEGGFLTSPQDARRIASPKWRDALATAISDGILAYIRLASEKISPPRAADYRAGKAALATPAPDPKPAPATGSPSASGISLRPLPPED